MPQSLCQTFIHLVFSTKNRQPFLADAALRTQTHAYLHGICKNLNCPTLRVGGATDHVHLLLNLSATQTIADLIRDMKRDSAKWFKLQPGASFEFYWQNGDGAFSLSPAHIAAVKAYIARQEEHHKSETFQDEYRRLLKKYGREYDEHYVWD